MPAKHPHRGLDIRFAHEGQIGKEYSMGRSPSLSRIARSAASTCSRVGCTESSRSYSRRHSNAARSASIDWPRAV